MGEVLNLDIHNFKKLQNKEIQAFTYIYNKYWHTLFIHAVKLLEDETIAKDLVQDVFLKLWDNASDMQIDSNVGGYLYKMLRNRTLNYFVQNKISQKHLEIFGSLLKEYSQDTDVRLRTKIGQEIIDDYINELPQKMKEIFLLHRKEDLSYKEIAELKQVSENTVKKQISNALKILKKKLEILTHSFL